jgi:hypothetical protein
MKALGIQGIQSQMSGEGLVCPRCGRRPELIIETYITDGMRRVTYLHRCVCKWKKEIETLYIYPREMGKIYVLKEKKT